MLDDAELDADMADAERMIATGGQVAYETVRGLLRAVHAARQQLAPQPRCNVPTCTTCAALPVRDADLQEKMDQAIFRALYDADVSFVSAVVVPEVRRAVLAVLYPAQDEAAPQSQDRSTGVEE